MSMALLKDLYDRGVRTFSRRDLFRDGGFLTLTGLLGGSAAPARAASASASIYESIGVRPLINCYGVMTIIGGSLILPEVRRAMDDASRYYVHLDELAESVGRRLAELTGAEWGIVTAGCAAAMAHATSACIAGADPEKLQRLPDLTGLKNEVIVPKYSRNVYDHAVRMLGVKMTEVANKEEYQAAFNDRTAMVYALEPNNQEFGLEVLA
jgi:D-glucosaminate-6-phosphate ammonia-lyase